MTRSIFDPEGGETIRGRDRYTGAEGPNESKMPPSVVDGKVEDDVQASATAIDAAHANVNEVALTEEEAVERLQQMQSSSEANAKDANPDSSSSPNPGEGAQ